MDMAHGVTDSMKSVGNQEETITQREVNSYIENHEETIIRDKVMKFEPDCEDDLKPKIDGDSDGNWYEDGSDDGFDISEMSRELEKRCSHFHTIGYRDGIIAGKEVSAQKGFNAGFKQSVQVGYNWGLVRGITSAMVSLPECLKDKLVSSTDSKAKLEKLHKSTQSISTNGALKMFHGSMLLNESEQPQQHSQECFPTEIMADCESDAYQLDKFSRDLQSFLQDSPRIKLQNKMEQVANAKSLEPLFQVPPEL